MSPSSTHQTLDRHRGLAHLVIPDDALEHPQSLLSYCNGTVYSEEDREEEGRQGRREIIGTIKNGGMTGRGSGSELEEGREARAGATDRATNGADLHGKSAHKSTSAGTVSHHPRQDFRKTHVSRVQAGFYASMQKVHNTRDGIVIYEMAMMTF